MVLYPLDKHKESLALEVGQSLRQECLRWLKVQPRQSIQTNGHGHVHFSGNHQEKTLAWIEFWLYLHTGGAVSIFSSAI